MICTWPEGATKPAVPAPYAEEVWTGLEYTSWPPISSSAACSKRAHGACAPPARATTAPGAIPRTISGMRQLCTHAALSSYAFWSTRSLGLSFDQRRGETGFRPALAGDAAYFWSAGRGWGEIAFRGDSATLSVKGGELEISSLGLPTLPGPATVDGRPAVRNGEAIALGGARKLKAEIRWLWEWKRVARLELKDLRKSFQSVEVIHGINLTVNDGSFTVFVGPSGCGKSTLLRMIAGLEEVTSGEVLLDLHAPRSLSSRRAGHGNGVPIVCALSAYERLRESPLRPRLPVPACKAEIAARIARAADILQITALLQTQCRRSCLAGKASA